MPDYSKIISSDRTFWHCTRKTNEKFFITYEKMLKAERLKKNRAKTFVRMKI
ncbi:hypothetical protein MmTuc01_0356 [Methanosarcina mazei Tuc01]|uniref:Uncharacterized protein n=1 Tax=Methanosarcina mazei Tuc01 TaxID=1236903 RepID=M1Q6M8_METMZ|nr:hypothetical protein MmTuc01_0356 [Methanosarcina mazei Tuc01]